MKFEENWPRGSEEKSFKDVDGWTDAGWKTDGGTEKRQRMASDHKSSS